MAAVVAVVAAAGTRERPGTGLGGAIMGRQSRQGVLKRQRERKKAEKAALKREKRIDGEEEEPVAPDGDRTATREDLEALGIFSEPLEDPET